MDAKEAIKVQFMKEYAKKDFALIRVKSLCAATPVARTTFYAYFDNADDVRCEIEDDIIRDLETVTTSISGGSLPDMDFNLFMDAVEAYIKERWSDIRAFLVIQPNLRFMRKWKDSMKLHFRKRYPEKRGSGNYDAVAEIVASAMLSAYAYWMERPDTVRTEEMKPLIHQMLNALVTFL